MTKIAEGHAEEADVYPRKRKMGRSDSIRSVGFEGDQELNLSWLEETRRWGVAREISARLPAHPVS